MEKKLKTITEYFEQINLKAFCDYYKLSYEFTRQVLNGKKDPPKDFLSNLITFMAIYQEKQIRIFTELQNT